MPTPQLVADAPLPRILQLRDAAAGLVGSYDAAIVTKDASGKVHESKDEPPAMVAGGTSWPGAAVGSSFHQLGVGWRSPSTGDAPWLTSEHHGWKKRGSAASQG
jgi:hypothetical protein